MILFRWPWKFSKDYRAGWSRADLLDALVQSEKERNRLSSEHQFMARDLVEAETENGLLLLAAKTAKRRP